MRNFRLSIAFLAALGTVLSSCAGRQVSDNLADIDEPSYIQILERAGGGWTVVSVSPFDGSGDTLMVDKPLDRLVVMSTSHIGFLDAIGRLDVISGVSGADYVYSDEGSLSENIVDVGYDAAPDYERIVSVKPDVVLTYSVSAAKSPFVTKLEQLGIKTLTVNEHLERHPLARASYIRLFGALIGDMAAADSVFEAVKASYTALADSIARSGGEPRKVLLNIPYNDQWFVPSKESYLTAMIHDAGGEVLGSEEGRATSSVMSVEKAYTLAKDADCWLNVGWCSTLSQLTGVNPIFREMLRYIRSNASARGFGDASVVWNDNRRVNPKGGNDIWQSGVARPDLVLRDLAAILHPTDDNYSTLYYKPLD